MTLTRAQGAVVIDASVAIPFLRGEPEWGAFIGARIVAGDMLLAPPHFGLEVANALLRGTTLKSPDHVVDLLRALFATGIEEVATRPLAIEDAVRLAARYGLTVYDAAYLGLAIDVDGELATLDKALLSAADAEGVPIAAITRDGAVDLAAERRSLELQEQAEGERWAAAATDPEFRREIL